MLKLYLATLSHPHVNAFTYSNLKFNCNASHEWILTIHQFTIYRMGIGVMIYKVSVSALPIKFQSRHVLNGDKCVACRQVSICIVAGCCKSFARFAFDLIHNYFNTRCDAFKLESEWENWCIILRIISILIDGSWYTIFFKLN